MIVKMGTRAALLLFLLTTLPCLCLAAKLQGFRFLDNNSTKKFVDGQGTVTLEFPGVEFPLHLSICLKVNPDYHRFDAIPLLDITSLESGDEIMEIYCK